jgi:hypothetical protein
VSEVIITLDICNESDQSDFFSERSDYWSILLSNTERNRIRYTNLKIYCDQTNSNITTQFLTEHFLTFQVFLQVFNIAVPGSAADIETIF